MKFLARYTHRVAISNRRLLQLENGQVTFAWKDFDQSLAQGRDERTPGVKTAVAFFRKLVSQKA